MQELCQNQDDAFVLPGSPGADTGGEVCRLRLRRVVYANYSSISSVLFLYSSARVCVCVSTESVVPGQPTTLHVRPQSNSVHVRWTAPAESGIKIRGYVLGYGVGIPDVFRQVLDAGQRHHTIRALRQCKFLS